MTRLTARDSVELLKHTPMYVESRSERDEREQRHRALPQSQQPWMVCYFGMLDYGVLWIGPDNGPERDADAEAEWWRDQIRDGLEILPFSRRPEPHSVMVRQQWDLDELTKAIRDSYR